MTTFKMDNLNYDVEIIQQSSEGQFLYKYADRTENGDLKSEAIGFFQNLSITFKGGNSSDFVDLYTSLSEVQSDGTFNHDIEFESPTGSINQKMYPDKLSTDMVRLIQDGDNWWGEMTVKFIAVSKS